MSKRDKVCDARCQLFYKEIAKKEAKIRNLWFNKNKERLLNNLENSAQKDIQIHSNITEEAETAFNNLIKPIQVRNFTLIMYKMYKIFLKNHKLKLTKKKLKSWRHDDEENDDKNTNEKESINFDLMRPISPNIKNIIYHPKERSFSSKKRYLKERLSKI